jgi:hypothetical protein
VPYPTIVFRLCVDIFRVLTFEEDLLTPASVIDYVNSNKEFFPLSVAQVLWLFQFTDEDVKNYELKEFIKKFYY